MRVIVIEDHLKINHLITLYCKQEGYRTTSFFSAEEALNYLSTHHADLIITDLMLKEMSGETFIKKMRSVSDVYIIVVSAKVETEDRIDVLTLGADDYIVKPFSISELMIRVRNAAKRLQQDKSAVLSYANGMLKIHSLKKEVMVNQSLIALTGAEYRTLMVLVTHANQTLSRNQMLTLAMLHEEATERTVDVHIKNIRKKLQFNDYDWIKTIYGEGYQFRGEKDV